MNLSKIIDDLKITLANDAFDIVHDINHHYEVWKNCVEIMDVEKLELDRNALEITAWSHDLETYNKNNDFIKLKAILNHHNVQDTMTAKIIKIIDEHSWSKKQTLLESKVIFDADKLEFVSIPRWEYSLQAFKDQLITEARMKKYEGVMNEVMFKALDRFYFESTKIKYEKLLKEFIGYAKLKNIFKNGKIRMNIKSIS